jgi:transposase
MVLRRRRDSAVGAGEEVAPASDYRALQQQVREMQRLLGKKAMENEILHEALALAQLHKGCCARPCPVRMARH